jgi:hypothetical protein
MTPFTCLIPMRTVAEGNAREHWRVRHKRRKREAATVELYLLARRRGLAPPRVGVPHVTLTRVGKRRMDPDNLASCFKATMDTVAIFLGIDDGRISWRFDQEIGKEYAVRVHIETKGA